METGEVGFRRVFPTVLELLSLTAAALREACIADIAIVGENLSAGLMDGLCHMRTGGFGDALIALTVVVGTDIEDRVVFAIVPADDLIVFLRK